jgi:hypothetical protein
MSNTERWKLFRLKQAHLKGAADQYGLFLIDSVNSPSNRYHLKSYRIGDQVSYLKVDVFENSKRVDGTYQPFSKKFATKPLRHIHTFYCDVGTLRSEFIEEHPSGSDYLVITENRISYSIMDLKTGEVKREFDNPFYRESAWKALDIKVSPDKMKLAIQKHFPGQWSMTYAVDFEHPMDFPWIPFSGGQYDSIGNLYKWEDSDTFLTKEEEDFHVGLQVFEGRLGANTGEDQISPHALENMWVDSYRIERTKVPSRMETLRYYQNSKDAYADYHLIEHIKRTLKKRIRDQDESSKKRRSDPSS